ncbi:hypothetical protein OA179_01640 [Candidatus Pelagibacter sp.]|nr:hypothetical protein [Candidatus Pelagibacter sp.]
MKILYIHSNNEDTQFYNDYLNDLLLHGLRDLYGENVVDFPGCWYLYKDEILKRKHDEEKFWGKGFTIKNILNDYNSIDRENIHQKIKNKYFNLVIYGSIRRSDLFLDDVIKYNNKFIFIDGEDDNFIEEKYSNLGLYFKRELISKNSKVLPISFAIPKNKILDKIDKNPERLLAPLIPGKLNTYIYDSEDSYYEMYKKSIFGLTYKKAGWDCLRHYEILMNGCIPLFLDLKDCPNDCITTLPKKELIEFLTKFEKILNLYNQFKIFKKKHLTLKRIFSPISLKSDKERLIDFLNKNEIIFNIKDNLLDFTKKNLTTEILAKNIIAKIK